MSNKGYPFDALHEMKDAYLVAASAVAEVDSTAKSVDIGPGRFDGALVIDVTAIEIASNDERYDIVVEGSNAVAFDSGCVALAVLPIGALETLPGGGTMKDSTIGRYELKVTNDYDGVIYRYLRVYTVVAGTIATGINYKARLGREYGG